MLDTILDLTKKLIKIKSTYNNPGGLNEALDIVLVRLQDFTIERFSKNGFPSVLIYNTKERPKRFKIILNGHLDVIPGNDSLYRPRVVGNRLYGIGSMDMKASVACLVEVFKNIGRKVTYPIGLQLVTDEQTGGLNGTKYQVEKGVRADFVIAGETTNLNIVNQAKGVVWVKILSKGKSAHSAYPWRAQNSLLRMQEFLNKLKEKYPTPKIEVWKSTVSLSKLETSNDAFNRIPDDCTAWLDIRYIPTEKEQVLHNLKKMLGNGCSLEIIFEEPALKVENNNKYIVTLQTEVKKNRASDAYLYSAHGTSDLTHYARVCCKGVEFGPVGKTGNTFNEYIEINSLETYYKVLMGFLLTVK